MAKGKFDMSEFLKPVGMPDAALPEQSGSRTVETITSEILHLQRVGGEAVLGIGQRLIEAKSMLEHGQWCDWLAESVNYSERAAQRLMRLAREWSNPTALSDLGATKALLVLSLPADERESFLAENHIVDGEEKSVVDMTSRELQKAIADRETALAERQAAEDARAKMAEDMAALKKLHADSVASGGKQEKEIAKLRKELKSLREKPVEVAVMSVDQEKIDAARAEATAAMQRKLDQAVNDGKRLEDARKKLENELTELRTKLENAEKNEKRAQMSKDKDLVVFDVAFGQAQEDINKLHGLYIRVRNRGDDELAEKLRRALLALAESVRGCAE